MRGMFPYVARVDYYDYPTHAVKAKYILTYGKNASSVVAQFEQDYGEDFLGVSVRVVSDEDFEFEISETMANEFVIKNGILADPVTVMEDQEREEDDNF